MFIFERFLLVCLIVIMFFLVYLLETTVNPVLFIIISFGFIFGYLLYLLSHTRRIRKRIEPYESNHKPFISILIAERNEITVIPDTIKNIKELKYPKDSFEIIIIDDNSSDGTYEYLQTVEGIKLVKKGKDIPPGKPTALNAGLAEAKGDYILILDADARLFPDYLDHVVAEVTVKKSYNPNIRAIQTTKRITNRTDNYLTLSQDNEMLMDALIAKSRANIGGGSELRGNGMMIDTKALKEVGEFTPGVLTDDLDMSTKLHLAGYDIAISDHIAIYEEAVLSFNVLLKQRIRWGEGSLRRYLEYLPAVVASRKIPVWKKADIVIFFVEFIFPMMLVIDILYNTVTLHMPGYITGTILALIFVSFLLPFIFSSLARNYDKLVDALLSTVYMFHWLIVIFYVIIIVLIKNRPSAWIRTPHQNR